MRMIKLLALGTAALALSGGLVSASTVGYVTSVTYNSDFVAAGRGTDRDRHIGANAIGETDGEFFEIGLFDTVYFHFDPDFVAPEGAVIEITDGSRSGWVEKANIAVGWYDFVAGIFTEGDPVTPNPITNALATAVFTFAGGPYNTIRLSNHLDTKVDSCTFESTTYRCGGYDVDSIRVTSIPVPATGALLLSVFGLGGFAAMRRRKAAA